MTTRGLIENDADKLASLLTRELPGDCLLIDDDIRRIVRTHWATISMLAHSVHDRIVIEEAEAKRHSPEGALREIRKLMPMRGDKFPAEDIRRIVDDVDDALARLGKG